MTPLEELQAAHARLSQLRKDSVPGSWYHEPEAGDIEILSGETVVVSATRPWHGWNSDIYTGDYEPTAELIVTLHQTIDAQLHIIAEAILVHARHWEDPRKYKASVSEDAMELARAINGEAS